MTKQSKKVRTRRKWIALPLLKLTIAELASGEWAVVSEDSARPLTEKEAELIIAGYSAAAELTQLA